MEESPGHLAAIDNLEQMCKRLDRRVAPKVASDRADSLPASLTFLRFALNCVGHYGHRQATLKTKRLCDLETKGEADAIG
jgi:hypothetical protein